MYCNAQNVRGAYLPVRQANAMYVFKTYYADAMIDLIHPGNCGDLPPSPDKLARKARQLGLMDQHHEWIIGLL